MIQNKIKTVFICLTILAGVFAAPLTTLAAGSCTTQQINNGTCVDSQKLQKQINNNPIVGHINDGVTFLSAVVGIVIVGSLIAGGVQYSTAGGNASKVTEARKRIMNSFVALFFFLLLWAFVQWLIPGGVFG